MIRCIKLRRYVKHTLRAFVDLAMQARERFQRHTIAAIHIFIEQDLGPAS